MDKKLHLLDSFRVQGADGAAYKVMAYEHMLRTDVLQDGAEHWEPTGLTEYRLESGERVDLVGNGVMRVVPTGLELRRTEEASATPAGGKGKRKARNHH